MMRDTSSAPMFVILKDLTPLDLTPLRLSESAVWKYN